MLVLDDIYTSSFFLLFSLSISISLSLSSLDHIRFLFDDYKLSRWYFEIVDLYRRILFTGVLPLTTRDISIVAYMGSFLAILSAVYYRELVPYRVKFTNFIAVIGQYVILLVFMAVLLIESGSLKALHMTDFTLGLILLAVNGSVLLFAFWGGVMRYEV
jgi:hypothetical protein